MRTAAVLLVIALLAGCGGTKPAAEEEYVPKIYAVEQQEKAAAALRLGDEAEAEAAATRAIEHDPHYPEPYVTKATVLARRGALAEAKSLLDTCVGEQPGFADAHLFRGVILDEQNNHDAARADFEAASKAFAAMASAHPESVELGLKYAIAEYLRAGMSGMRLAGGLVARFPDYTPARFIYERMVAQDRAFAFRWLMGIQPAPATLERK